MPVAGRGGWMGFQSMKTHFFLHFALATALAGAALSAVPDPLALPDGGLASSPEMWRTQVRPLTLRQFREQVYGVRPATQAWNVVTKLRRVDPMALNGSATLKELEITISGPGGAVSIRPVLVIPNAAKSPAATFLVMNFRKPDLDDPENAGGDWPVREIIQRGYATVAFDFNDADPDRVDGFGDGVRGLLGNEPRADNAWGALSAWGWAASRVMDYLQTDPAVDAARVAVVGHSRAGKAALWCGAEDERFSLVISNNSGCGGAAISRTKKGERISNITTKFPHWFSLNFKKYSDREADLPVDQHQLLGLIAPRLLYVASATEDPWADPASEFEACVRVGPVYALFGKNGLATDKAPAPDVALHGGAVGYHLRTGKHDLALSDWVHFMDFADQHGWAAP